MFERFTDRARRIVVLAQEEARLLNHNYIGTEHILLGLSHERGGIEARALESVGVSAENVRRRVEEIIGTGQSPPGGHIPFTPRAKKVFELALRESLKRGDNYIGTEHLLLGVIRQGEGVAVQALTELGASLERVRDAVDEVLLNYEPGAEDRPGRPSTRSVDFAHISERVEASLSIGLDAEQTDEPCCPRCRRSLIEFGASRSLDFPDAEGGSVGAIAVFCRGCGMTLQILQSNAQ